MTHSWRALLQALVGIHMPKDAAEVEAAKRRLVFEELLLLQLKLLLRREIDRTPRSEVDLVGTRVEKLGMMQAGRNALGFRLTAAQDRVLAEVMLHPAPVLLNMLYTEVNLVRDETRRGATTEQCRKYPHHKRAIFVRCARKAM